MKVFVVLNVVHFEGSEIIDIYAKSEDAENCKIIKLNILKERFYSRRWQRMSEESKSEYQNDFNKFFSACNEDIVVEEYELK